MGKPWRQIREENKKPRPLTQKVPLLEEDGTASKHWAWASQFIPIQFVGFELFGRATGWSQIYDGRGTVRLFPWWVRVLSSLGWGKVVILK